MTIRIVNAQLEYYLGIDNPDELSDDVWAKKFQNLTWVRTEEAKRNPFTK